jgi:hypothetical protein
MLRMSGVVKEIDNVNKAIKNDKKKPRHQTDSGALAGG